MTTVDASSTPEADTNNTTPTITKSTVLPTKWHVASHSTATIHSLIIPTRDCPGQQKLDAQGNCRDIVFPIY